MTIATPPADYTAQPQETKCCVNCAFRVGSRERNDPFAWIQMLEDMADGEPFYCHKSVPGHPGEVADDRPRWRLCAGWHATREVPLMKLVRLGNVKAAGPQV